MTHDQTIPSQMQVKPNAKRLLKQYVSFQHLCAYINQGSDGVITMCMNKHLLHGETLPALAMLAKEDNKRLGSNDFLTIQRIKRHIGWCCEPQRGWLIQKNKFDVYRIVGYRGERDSQIDTEHTIQKSNYSILASKEPSNPLAKHEKLSKLPKEKKIVSTRNFIRTGESQKRMENLLKDMVKRFLQDNAAWLTTTFKITEQISSNRGNRYGFEWPIQAAFGYFLLGLQESGKISSVGVGKQESNKKKYDITFVESGRKIIIEIKTPSGGAISYAKSDVQKMFPTGSLPFFLIFSDPNAPPEAPSLTGTNTIGSWVTHEGFRCYLYIKKFEQQL